MVGSTSTLCCDAHVTWVERSGQTWGDGATLMAPELARTAVVTMSEFGLFSHLARRLGAQPEVLAAETLAYLLASSAAVREAVVELCAIAAPGIANAPAGLQFRATVPDADGQAPALLGIDAEGVTRFVVDPRFWSAPGEDQPLRLLRHLTMGRGGALLMLAPTPRFTSLWAELRRRCRLANLPVHGDHAVGDPIRWTRVGARQVVILASWGALLVSARGRALAAGDRQTVADIDQLATLCAQMEAETFAPLTADDLASVSARRLAHLFELVDDLARACEEAGLGQVAAGQGWSGPGYFGRHLQLGTTRLTVFLCVHRWATLRETPYWLLVHDRDGRPARGAFARLEPLASEIPPRVLRDAEADTPLVPLFPAVGVTREAAIGDLVRQVSEVARLLGEGPTAGFGSRA